MENKSKKWLYNELSSIGYNVGKDYNEFDSLVTNNEESRKWVYETLRTNRYNVGKDYNEFSETITRSQPTQQTAPSAPSAPSAPRANNEQPQNVTPSASNVSATPATNTTQPTTATTNVADANVTEGATQKTETAQVNDATTSQNADGGSTERAMAKDSQGRYREVLGVTESDNGWKYRSSDKVKREYDLGVGDNTVESQIVQWAEKAPSTEDPNEPLYLTSLLNRDFNNESIEFLKKHNPELYKNFSNKQKWKAEDKNTSEYVGAMVDANLDYFKQFFPEGWSDDHIKAYIYDTQIFGKTDNYLLKYVKDNDYHAVGKYITSGILGVKRRFGENTHRYFMTHDNEQSDFLLNVALWAEKEYGFVKKTNIPEEFKQMLMRTLDEVTKADEDGVTLMDKYDEVEDEDGNKIKVSRGEIFVNKALAKLNTYADILENIPNEEERIKYLGKNWRGEVFTAPWDPQQGLDEVAKANGYRLAQINIANNPEKLNSASEHLEELRKKANDAYGNSDKLEFALNATLDGYVPGTPNAYDLYLMEKGYYNPIEQTKLAIRLREEAQDMAEDAKSDGSLSRFWEGLKAGATDADLWTGGLSSVADGFLIRDVMEKYNADKENLTKEEEMLLDAFFTKLSVEAYTDRGIAYDVGRSIPESIGFMLSFLLSPTSGLAGGLTRKFAKWAIKKYGKGVIRANATKFALGKGLAYGVGSAANAGATSFTTGAGFTAKNISDELAKSYDPNEDKFVGDKKPLTAIAKGLYKTFNEVFVEEAGGSLLKSIFKPIDWGLGKISPTYNQSKELWEGFASGKGFKQFKAKTGFNGTPIEFGEEILTDIANLPISNDTFDADEQTGIFGTRRMVTTGLSCLAIGTMMNTPNAVTYQSESKRIAKYRENTNNLGSLVLGKKWEGIKSRIDNATPSEIEGVVMQEMMKGKLTTSQKKAILKYAGARVQQDVLLLRENELAMEAKASKVIDAQGTLNDKTKEGYNATDENEQRRMAILAQQSEQEVKAMLGENEPEAMSALNTRYGVTTAEDLVAKVVNDESLTPEQRNAILNFINTDASKRAIEKRMADDANAQIEQVSQETKGKANIENPDFIINATLKGASEDAEQNVTIKAGNVGFNKDGSIDLDKTSETLVVVNSETGEQEMISPKEIKSVSMQDVQATIDEKVSQIKAEHQRRLTQVTTGERTFEQNQKITLSTEDGSSVQGATITGVTSAEDGTLMVTYVVDGTTEPITIPKADVESRMDNAIRMKQKPSAEIAPIEGDAQVEVAQAPQAPTIATQEQTAPQQEYVPGKAIVYQDADGNYRMGEVVQEVDPDGNVIIVDAFNGVTHQFSSAQLDQWQQEANAPQAEKSQAEESQAETPTTKEEQPQGENAPTASEEQAETTPQVESTANATNEASGQEIIDNSNEVEQNAPITPTESTPQAETPSESAPQDANDSKLPSMEAIPTDENGKKIYEQAPIEATINDIYNDPDLDEEEADAYVQARIDGATKRVAELEKKKPKMGEDRDAYVAQRDTWRAEREAEQAKLDYWQGVQEARKNSTSSAESAEATPIEPSEESVAPIVEGVEDAQEESSDNQEEKLNTKEENIEEEEANIPMANESSMPIESTEEVEEIEISKATPQAKQSIKSKPGVVKNSQSLRLPKGQVKLLDRVAKALGVQIEFVPTMQGANAKIVGNKVTVALDAEQIQRFGADGVTIVIGHELTHRIKALSNEAFEDFAHIIESILPEQFKQLMINTRIAYSRQGLNIGKEALREEVVADLAGLIMTDGNLMEEFLKELEPKSTKQQILDVLKQMFNALKGVFQGKTARDLANAERVLLDAMKEANKVVAQDETTEADSATEKLSIIGESGASALDQAEEASIRMDNLDMARKMERFDYPTKAIRMATGWERGADGKWRYEIEDVKLKKTTYENTETTLDELVDNAELFSAYPSLKNLKVVFTDTPNDTLGQTHSQYAENENGQGAWIPTQISLNNLLVWSDAETESVLTHEIQHAIQRIEGFASGGNLTNEDVYTRLAGEVEARNVQSRIGMTPEQRRATLLAETEDVARKDQIFLMENSGVSAMAEDANESVVDINEQEGQALFSLRSYNEGGRDAVQDFVNKQVDKGALTQEQANEIVTELEDIYNICEQYKDEYAPFGAWSDAKVVADERGVPVFSVIKKNGDYGMNLDFSLVCKKRRTLDAVFQEMINRGVISNFELGQVDIARINDIIREHGFETACRLCFVDSKRFRTPKVADDFANLYNELVEMSDAQLKKVIKGEAKNTVRKKTANHLLKHPEDRIKVGRDNFITAQGFEQMQVERPEILKLYNQAKGSGGPKASFGDTQYMNDIQNTNWTPEKAYAVGGVRLQSFSDYVPRMVFDYVQLIADLASKGLPVHAYTKEPIFAKQFGLTGVKINLSLVPRVDADGVAPGLDKDGNYAWQDGESFPYDEAVALQNAEGYKENVGTIAVGVSDAHIAKMLDDPNIRMVIPYHKSGLNKQVAIKNNIDAFNDYTTSQNTRKVDGTKVDKKGLKGQPDFNQDVHNGMHPRDAAQKYLDWCDKKGYLPKFDQFRNHPNYYKLLEDFTTIIDENGAEQAVPQGAVKMQFPTENNAFGSMESLIKEGLEEDAILEGNRQSKVSDIVDEIEDVLSEDGAKYSLRSSSQEVADIVAKAKADGTYMKAPNGEPTNLTEEQWANVRTKAFKDWFGDWELANLYNRAVDAWNNKNSKGKCVFGLSEKARERFNELLGNDARQLIITDDAIRHIKNNHGENEELRGQKNMTPEDVVVIPYLINNFDSMELNPEFDDKLGNKAVEIRKRINGVSIVATIERGKNKEFLVSNYQFIKSDAIDASKETPGPNVRNDSDIAKVRKEIETIKENAKNSSKIVDENGEPKVVYHGGNISTIINSNSLFFMTDNLESAGTYSGKAGVTSLFDNVTVPKELSYEDGREHIRELAKKRGWTSKQDVESYVEKLLHSIGAELDYWPYRFVKARFKDGSVVELHNSSNFSWDNLSAVGTVLDNLKKAYSNGEMSESVKKRGNFAFFANLKNPLIVDAKGSGWENIKFDIGNTAKGRNNMGIRYSNGVVDTNAIGEYAFRNGYDGVVIENINDSATLTGSIGEPTTDYIAFNPNQIKSATDNVGTYSNENDDTRYSLRGNTPFYSNAEYAVENIKQGKATPEQWLAMIQKNGGLKAGEDKWLGLSDWLKASDAKTLTKEEVLEFINQNKIVIEEVGYEDYQSGVPSGFGYEFRNEMHEYAQDIADNARQEYEDMGYDEEDVLEETRRAVEENLRAKYNDDAVYFISLGNDFEIIDTGNDRDFSDFADAIWHEKHGNVSSRIKPANSTRIAYTTNGLENKREIALVVPTINPYNKNDEIHFGDAGGGRAVAWIRFGETTDADGNRVLVIDEIQSKRHQDGREKGYHANVDLDILSKNRETAKNALNAFREEKASKYGTETFGPYLNEEELAELYRLEGEERQATFKYNRIRHNTIPTVPDAPFEKNWHELAMKRMLRYATENGYDKVAWTTGAQQAERYDIGTLVNHVHVINSEEERYVSVSPNSGRIIEMPTNPNSDIITSGEYKGQRLQDVFGKELAEKILSVEIGNDVRIAGEDLRIGGEGMKGFYDKMLPSFMNKYGKKWGVKVGEVTMPNIGDNGLTMHSIDVTDAMKESVMEGQPMFRDGSGALSDTDLSYANDPFAKALGKSQRSKDKQAKFAERERKAMRNRVAELVEKLGIGERVELIEGGEFDNERKARAKGWYDVKSGKIVINLANHTSVADIERTLLHEAVSHHGLRELFGKQFDTFLDNVFRSADYNIRTQIVGLATRNGWDFRTATEEYLAQLAEDTNFEALENNWSFWSKIKQLFMDMLESIGWNYQGPTLTDNELRYLLWRSYENMVNPGRHRSILGMAEDATKREKFGIGTYRTDENVESQVADGEGVKYSLVSDPKLIAELDASPKRIGYRNVVMNEDGTFGSPMASGLRNKGKGKVKTSSFALGEWEQAEENPDLANENGKINLVKPDGKSVDQVDYNPYIHNRVDKVNAQFKQAWERPNLVYVETEIPLTDLESGYHADKAKLPVGVHSWSNGDLILSRYDKPVRVVPWEEVADDWVERFGDRGVEFDIVPPALLPILVERGVEILPPHKGMGKNCIEAYEQWKAEQEGETKYSLRGVLHPKDGGDIDGTREEYDKRVKTTTKKFEKSAMTFFNFMEAFVDEMRSLDILQRIVEKKYGIKLPSFENALDAENRSSSMALKEFEAFMDGEYDAMMQFVDRWIKSGETTQSINYYMIAKSGLERNREFTVRDAINELLNHEDESKRITKAQAEQMRKNYADERNALLAELKSGNIDYVTFNKLADKLARKYAFGHKIEDYSGLTGITGDENNFRQIAEDMVLEFEAKHEDAVVDFWSAVKDVTKAPVRKSYGSGLLSKSMYDKLTTMFEWYIPMRGFEEQTAEDVYSYIGADTGVFNPTVALAKGHTEVSDDPLAIMGNMMQSAILQGNRNVVKQRLLFMARNHPVDVLTESRVWLVLHPDGTWVSSYPELSNDISADQVAQAIAEHEAKMEKLAKDKKAKISNVNLDIDFKIEKASNISAHAIDVMLNGNHYVIYVNGNPRVAQAVNGQLKDKGTNWLYEVWQSYARWYTASKTSLDVNFMFPNVVRDIQHSTLMTIMDKGFIQGVKFFFNGFATIIPVIKGASGVQIKDPKMRKYWDEFVKYGGETGYAHLESVDDFKRKNEKRLKRMKGAKKATTIAKGTFKYIGSAFDYANRIAESSTRFNAYVSSRKSGADIYDAIRYAKDITVNFNRKGSSMAPGIFGAMANFYRFWMPFANPIIQGIYQFLKVGRRNKGRFFTICGVQMALGFVIPMVNEILFEAIGGDDEDKYINQPDYARRTNMMFYIGGKYIKIPLPPMFRELYGLGDIAWSYMKGLYDTEEATWETVDQIRSMFSLQGQSSMEGKEFSVMRFILPGHLAWIADIEENTTFTGQPLYKEGDFIDEQTPEYQKVYNGTWRYLVEWSRELNHFLGGTDDKAAEMSSKWMNPAVWQHVISEFGGGPYKFVMDMADLVSPESNDEGEPAEFTWSKVPVAKRFVAEVGDRAETRLLNKQYYDYIDSFDDIEYEEKVYTKKAKMGSMEYAEKLNELILSPEYREYKVKNGYEKAVKDLNKYLNDPGLDKSDRKQVEDAIERFKREVLTEAPKAKNFPTDGASKKVKEKLDSIKDVVEDVIGDGNEQTKERNRVIRDAKSDLKPLNMEVWKEEQKDKVK